MTDILTSDVLVHEAHQRQQHGAVLLDVREPYEFALSHAPTALNIPLGQLSNTPGRDQRKRRSAGHLRLRQSLGARGPAVAACRPFVGPQRVWRHARLAIGRTACPVGRFHRDAVACGRPGHPHAGLGDTTYLLSHRGRGVVVDPQRDVDRFLDAADAQGVRIRYVLETHVHNDYVSGGRELARRAHAELVLPAGAGVAFDHTPAFHLEDLAEDDGFMVRPIHTPGHTPEHVSYLVFVDGQPGGAVFGWQSPGRLGGTTGPARHRTCPSVSPWRSSSPCSAWPACQTSSGCIPPTARARSAPPAMLAGVPRRSAWKSGTNPLLQHRTAEAFAQAQLAELQPYPKYYAFMGRINTLGPEPLPELNVPELTPEDVHARLADVHVVDARPRAAFARRHIPGSLGIELADDFGTWVGWLVPFNAPIVLVLDPDQDLQRSGRPVRAHRLRPCAGCASRPERMASAPASKPPVTTWWMLATFARAVADGRARQVLDVRSPAEWQRARCRGAHWRYVPDLTEAAPAE